MNFLVIDKNIRGGIIIEDSITNEKRVYYCYSERDAIQKHRRENNLQHKHFTKIYL